MAILISKLVEDFESCVGKAPYPDSGSGSTNLSAILNGAAVDCSGIFVAAFKNQGGSIYHGSNTIWRKYLSDKGSISNHGSSNGYPKNVNPLKSSQLEVGMAVFKWNNNTPSKFNDGQGDYQHIGLVTSVNPLRIVHSTSENHNGVVVDTKIGKWCAWGKFTACNYNNNNNNNTVIVETTIKQEENIHQEVMENMNGTLKTNVTLNIRADKTTRSAKLGTIPAKTTLAFSGAASEGWVEINYNGINGYICTTNNYVTVLNESVIDNIDEDNQTNISDDMVEEILQLKNEVETLKNKIDDLLFRIS